MAVEGATKAWYRRPRSLAVLVLVVVGVIVGAFMAVNRHSAHPPRGSSGPNTTIGDYLDANDISQTPVRVGEPGTPVITLPLPPGWSDAGPDTPPGVYGELLYDNAAKPDDVPFIDIYVSRLDGDADAAKVLEHAPGELMNLPGYQAISEPNRTKLGGFDAVQLGGLYTKNGAERIIAQKTVVIPSPNGLFVLQMNADGPKAEAPAVQQATVLIDEQAKIVP